MQEQTEKWCVTDRRLENFLYAHRVDFIAQTKDRSGKTVWIYLDTERFREVVAEYRLLYIDG